LWGWAPNDGGYACTQAIDIKYRLFSENKNIYKYKSVYRVVLGIDRGGSVYAFPKTCLKLFPKYISVFFLKYIYAFFFFPYVGFLMVSSLLRKINY
jgi:hypothetical protein